MKKVYSYFTNIKLIAIGGIFLLISLVLLLTKWDLPIDPAWVTIVISGYPIIYTAIDKLINGKGMNRISSSLLISIAMIASIAIGEVFAAGEIAFIMAIGEFLEDKTIARAKNGLKDLVSLIPQTARLLINSDEKIVTIDDVKVNDVIRVLPGESIPIDGIIVAGTSSINQAVLTGESLPIDKSEGDEVFCGTINLYGSIDIKATKVGEDSSLQKLIKLVKEVEDTKAPTEKIVDRWASFLVPLALIIALLAYIFTSDIIRAVTILVVFCPCALVLATPTSIMAAIGQATKHGVIVKSGEALENMGNVNLVTFDKTGTLTKGNLVVSDVVSLSSSSYSTTEILRLAASLEIRSEHPIGKAIVKKAKKESLQLEQVGDFTMIPGKGISGVIDDKRFYCGNISFLNEFDISLIDATSSLDKIRGDGKAIIILFSKDEIIGVIGLSDTLRKESKKAIEELRALDVKTVLLTGDHKLSGDYIARCLGIDEVYSDLLPEEKLAKISEFQSDGNKVCMVGDGVNDAPALKKAEVGIAMGAFGSDVAVDSADIALMNDDISNISYLKRLSIATVKLIKFNITLSIVINFIAIILSLMAILNPVTGALVHNISSVLIVLNAVRLYDKKFK